ncbi:hypothetical protein [Microbacterium halophytorum]|uniref:hypothetical protein n=1 Tax=Microbacterium halophytorum TaxID=2067568 RepID=UPI000CFE2FFB|nr:hypothetical protein [Microbacterium halophytorum]
MGSDSSPEERGAWISLVVAAGGYAAYLIALFASASGGPLAEAAYVWPMVWAVGASVLVSIALHAALGLLARRDPHSGDERDVLIGRWSERIGHAFVVLGALAALVLVMVGAPGFWVANAIFLGFFLSAVFSSVAKISAYRGGFDPRW